MSGINLSQDCKSIFDIVQAIIQIAQGRSNSVGTVTLTAGATSTVVTKAVDKAAVNMSLNAAVFLSPITVNAQAINYSWWISAKGQGTFTVSHANTANVDQSFNFEIRGG